MAVHTPVQIPDNPPMFSPPSNPLTSDDWKTVEMLVPIPDNPPMFSPPSKPLVTDDWKTIATPWQGG